MMSVSNVAAGAAASGYYHAEGYYVAGSAEAQAAASWAGGAAEPWGFATIVRSSDYMREHLPET